MASDANTASFAKPKLSELVPILIGEANFVSWSTALKCALDTLADHADFNKYTSKSRRLLSYLHATVHASLKPYINIARNTYSSYQSLYKTFAVHTYNTGLHKWVTLRYANDNSTTL
ncbi:hypothetical protein N7517_003606 [Penicillium concentricum]|uniref:Uncharacterized protein n=1 Tax=Penicillium concentricum TaxID=293559 RepID=A0A9W9S482_9EURO|nr:uncharacterized protein N7517_003606 [Penicillium concentricum]KAJ5371600.1 hypothetical protein N7517_003606 [Penicillium concentricum]